MHEHLTNIGVINWDVTLNEKGEVVLIEMNINGCGIWLPQLADGKPSFGDLTADILQWLAFMEKTKLEDRKKYLFGNRDDEK